MEFIKIYEDTDFNNILNDISLPLISNYSAKKIAFKDSWIYVDGKKTYLSQVSNNSKFYAIDDNFCILFDDLKYHHLICIKNNMINARLIEGIPTYIGKRGYLSSYRIEQGIQIQKAIFNEFGKCEINTINFAPNNYYDIFAFKGYVLYHQEGRKLTAYIEKESFIEDFDGANDIKAEYFFTDKPLLTEPVPENILVKFKDQEKVISSQELIALNSNFINDQLLSSEELYLDLNYSEFKYETLKFLEYIRSYGLWESIKNKLIETIIDGICGFFMFQRSDIIKRMEFLRSLDLSFWNKSGLMICEKV